MWVKVCGNTSLADAELAMAAGADAVGFVFADSKRQVDAQKVREIVQGLSRPVETIGVFVTSSFETIAQTVEATGLTGVQLHGGGDSSLAAQLRERFAARDAFRILRVIHFGDGLRSDLETAQADPSIDGVLVDSRVGKLVGGTGVPFHWQEAREGFTRSALRLVAAGGLHPENVAEAIATLVPWGVDVVTGVEASPGRKDAEKVRLFVENARRAALRLEDLQRVAVQQ